MDNVGSVEHNVPMCEQKSINDLNQLRVFAEVARTLSITKAARTLGMPKSTVSRDVARLEHNLGTLLLTRSGRRIFLTEAGVIFAQHAQQVMERVEEAADAVAVSTATPRGVITVRTTYVLGCAVLMPMMAPFMAQFPEINVVLEFENHGSVASHESDVLLAAGPLDDSNYVARKITEMKFQLYASPNYISRRGMPQSLIDLDGHDIVDKHWPRGAGPWVALTTQGTRLMPVRPRLLLNDMLGVSFALRQGVGVGWLPSFLAQEYLQTGMLVSVLPEIYCPPVEVYAIFPLRRTASPKILAFVDFLLEWTDNTQTR